MIGGGSAKRLVLTVVITEQMHTRTQAPQALNSGGARLNVMLRSKQLIGVDGDMPEE